MYVFWLVFIYYNFYLDTQYWIKIKFVFWDYYDQLVFITSNYNLYKYYNKFKGCAQYFSELTQDQKYIDFNVPDLNINITFLGFRDPATFVGTAFFFFV